MNLKKFAAIVALPALVAGGLILTQPANAAAPGDINPGATGSITVHKHEEPSGTKGVAGDGQQKPVAPEKPLQGAMFSVQKISGVDLTTREGWENVNNVATMLNAGVNPALEGAPVTMTTGADGIATFSGLAVGAYLVTETQTPAGALKAVNPFIVTVPNPNGADGGWNYNVHVYPKNSVSKKPVKELDDTTATKIGDNVKWTVTQTLPELPAGVEFSKVSFSDTLVNNLRFVDGSLVVKVDGQGVDFTDIVAGQTITAEVDNPGNLRSGQKVTYEFQTMIATAGAIKNVASTTVETTNGGSSTDGTTPVDDPTVPTVIIGHINIQNYVADSDNAPGGPVALSGGVFEVYKGEDCAGGKIDGLGDLTAGDNGKLAAAIALKEGKYGVKQVMAPVGYVLNNGCIPVAVTTANAADDPVFATVYNSKATVPALPLTGAQGQVILLAVGGVLVLVGLVAVVAVRCKRALVASK
ncbi:isopeptide-forming domain-containing fimbrial protein [Canibacter sp. lx-72]|uniref:SpaH/EbpB family LPXTG-anchored major pilin n=1 Tax=Canibacter zhuwentaonis TaxID=2837491 RepID=UPI001BDC7D74|nr:SpaH/EbpB family LPXTG-anchored major pilin [Canibacter zhuwentaonis]MBT1018408.1 isopeptide-forming domain-containing fimbrial protein [Canibacter zhuwentaonis]MBT1035597.1 isopeptide-forming domain-containing fimbrial protein [Canibacter zhuwentaonis]